MPAVPRGRELLGQEGVGDGGDDLELALADVVGAQLGADLLQPFRVTAGLLEGVDVADPAVVAGGAPEGDLGQPPDEDRDAAGRGVHLEARGLVELALELREAGLPQRLHQGDPLVGALPPCVEVLLEQLELLLAPADAQAEGDAPAGDHRGGAHHLGHRERVAHRGDVDAGEEADVRGHRGQGADQHPRVGPLGVDVPPAPAVGGVRVRRRQLLEVHDVVGDRDGVVAQLVGRPGELEQVVDGLERGDDREAHRPRVGQN